MRGAHVGITDSKFSIKSKRDSMSWIFPKFTVKIEWHQFIFLVVWTPLAQESIVFIVTLICLVPR